MPINISATPVFKKQFARLYSKYPSLADDIEKLKESLLIMPVQGISLGHDLYKVRLAIKSKGQGKSGGSRVITCIKLVENKIIMVALYDKSEQDTMAVKDLLKLLNY